MTILLFAGALVASFVVCLMAKYRCNRGVLTPEQEWN
jgi:hypothetical protein